MEEELELDLSVEELGVKDSTLREVGSRRRDWSPAAQSVL